MEKVRFKLKHHIHTFWVTGIEDFDTTRVYLDAGTIDITPCMNERDIARVRGRVFAVRATAARKQRYKELLARHLNLMKPSL